jgi:hypothetical protein
VNRFQQLLENNFQVPIFTLLIILLLLTGFVSLQTLLAIQQEMKVHGINLGAENLTNFPFRSPSLPQPKPNNTEKGSMLHDQEESHSHNTSTVISKSTQSPAIVSAAVSSPTPSSTISTSSPLGVSASINSNHLNPNGLTTDRERDKDKSFGKMSHYVNELKKELDSASRSRKELVLETQRLRERCIQFEEKLQSEKNKNLLLEEQLEKSSKKQRELQSQLDAFQVATHQQQQLQQQHKETQQQQQHQAFAQGMPNVPTVVPAAVIVSGENQQLSSLPYPPPLPLASHTTQGTLSSSSATAPLAPPPPLLSSTSGPIQPSILTPIGVIPPPAKSNSTSNIPSLSLSSASSLLSLGSLSTNPLLNPSPSSSSQPSISISANNTPRYGGGGDGNGSGGAGIGHVQLGYQDTSLMSTMSTVGSQSGFPPGGGDQIILQSDEFDNFIASRGAPSDEWTDATGLPTSPSSV